MTGVDDPIEKRRGCWPLLHNIERRRTIEKVRVAGGDITGEL
jgi:hypothetical protein